MREKKRFEEVAYHGRFTGSNIRKIAGNPTKGII